MDHQLPQGTIIACKHCGQTQRVSQVPPFHAQICVRCTGTIYRNRPRMEAGLIALAFTGLILFIITVSFPLVQVSNAGIGQSLTLFSACIVFWQQGFQFLAILMGLNILIFPPFIMISTLVVMLSIKRNRHQRVAIWFFTWQQLLYSWAMLEVFMLGLLVAIVKLGEYATVVVGPSLLAYGMLIIVTAAIHVLEDSFVLWNRLGPPTSYRGKAA